MIVATNVLKNFDIKRSSREVDSITVLKGLSFTVQDGEWVSIVGPSGGGKSTLLSLMAGLDVPTSGSIEIDGQKIEALSEDARCAFRARHMGFVFQSFRLIQYLSALENIRIPLLLMGHTHADERARQVLAQVGLSNRQNNLPSQLSGGEQQRVAVARAFVSGPKIVFADEPTGNLDTANGKVVLALLHDLQKLHNTTILLVTHDQAIAAEGSRTLSIRDGLLAND
jgi:putative ABC transport system ATP-binding protein